MLVIHSVDLVEALPLFWDIPPSARILRPTFLKTPQVTWFSRIEV
jgi:hypothetical protein